MLQYEYGEYGTILSLFILEHDLYHLNILWVLRQGCQEWMVEGPRKERRAGSATRAWNKPSDTSSTITWEQIITFSKLLFIKDNMKHSVEGSTLKNVRMKPRYSFMKTTTLRKVENPP